MDRKPIPIPFPGVATPEPQSFPEVIAERDALRAQVTRLEREKHDLETTLHRILDIAVEAGFQHNGKMLLSDFFHIRLKPEPLLTDEES